MANLGKVPATQPVDPAGLGAQRQQYSRYLRVRAAGQAGLAGRLEQRYGFHPPAAPASGMPDVADVPHDQHQGPPLP